MQVQYNNRVHAHENHSNAMIVEESLQDDPQQNLQGMGDQDSVSSQVATEELKATAAAAAMETMKAKMGMSCLDYLNMKGNNPQDAFIASGIYELDSVLRNGLRTGIITEIYGPDQSCKTSLALQFALNVLDHLFSPSSFILLGCSLKAIVNEKSQKKAYSIYLSTTKRPHQQRINQILEGIRSRNGNVESRSIEACMDQFIEVSKPSIVAFQRFIDEELPFYQARDGVIRLLVIDNIYDLASQYEDYREKQHFLFTFVNLLKRFAQTSSAAVLILNNVVANMNDNVVGLMNNSNNATLPALGNYWAHLINERFALSILNEVKGTLQTPLRVRSLAIKFSPRLPYDTFQFIPDNYGISPIA